MTNEKHHIPIMVKEIIDILDIQPHDVVLDGTIGFGGHAKYILPRLTNGHYIGIDQDEDAIAYCKPLFSDQNVTLIHDNYSKIKKHLHTNPKLTPTKILLDLGFSSYQLDSSGRGFSFLNEEPLDMRLSTQTETTAATILNTYAKTDLSDLFYHHGDLIHNKKLVENIIRHRPIHTTSQLQMLIKKSYVFRNRSQLMKTCSQVFQGLRIKVNNEMEHLTQFLESLPQITEKNARIAILTFHSGEDRLVKQFVNQHPQLKKINKKVIVANQDEIKKNSRSKPAKLRGITIHCVP
jgi:16S rRNA (cytosine1402-N4)-methyltransferase